MVLKSGVLFSANSVENIADIQYENIAEFSMDFFSNMVQFTLVPPNVIKTTPDSGYIYAPARANENLDSFSVAIMFDAKMLKDSVQDKVSVYNKETLSTVEFLDTWIAGNEVNFMNDTLVITIKTPLSGLTEYTILLDTEVVDGLLIPMAEKYYIDFKTIARMDESYVYNEENCSMVLPSNVFAADYFPDILKYNEISDTMKSIIQDADNKAVSDSNIQIVPGYDYRRYYFIGYYDGSTWVDYFDRNDDGVPDNILAQSTPELILKYDDLDNDGKVDGTDIDENYLIFYRLNYTERKWEVIRTTQKDLNSNEATTPIDRFGIYTVMKENPPSLSLSTQYDSITANGQDTTLITAYVEDNNGSPVSGDLIYFEIISGRGELLDTQVYTDAIGQASVVYRSDTQVSYITIKATDLTPVMPDAQDSIVIYLYPGPPDSIWISKSAEQITDSGKDTVLITFTVYDQFLNVVYDEPITAKVLGDGWYQGYISDTEMVTDAYGQATTIYTGTVYDGVKTIVVEDVQDNNVANTTTITIKDVSPPEAVFVYPDNYSDTVLPGDSIIVRFNDIMDTTSFINTTRLSDRNGTLPIVLLWQRNLYANEDTLYIVPEDDLKGLTLYTVSIQEIGKYYPKDASTSGNQLDNKELLFKTVYVNTEDGVLGRTGEIELHVKAGVMPEKYTVIRVLDYDEMADTTKQKLNTAASKLLYNIRVVPGHVFDYELEAYYYDTTTRQYRELFESSDGTTSSITLFNQPYPELRIYYKDDDNDGIEDRASVNVNTLTLYTVDEQTLKFEKLESKRNSAQKYIYASVPHLSLYTLLTEALPTKIKLYQNYPNPFNPNIENTTIVFDLAAEAYVTIDIFDITGTRIVRLLDEKRHVAGTYEYSWAGTNEHGVKVASGIYILRFEVQEVKDGKTVKFIKIAVLK